MSGPDVCNHMVPLEEPCEECLQDYMKEMERKRNARIQAIADLKADNKRLRWGLQWMLNNLTGIDHEWAKEACNIARQSLNP